MSEQDHRETRRPPGSKGVVATQVTRQCEQCGGTFTIAAPQAAGKRYCSKECYNRARNRRARQSVEGRADFASQAQADTAQELYELGARHRDACERMATAEQEAAGWKAVALAMARDTWALIDKNILVTDPHSARWAERDQHKTGFAMLKGYATGTLDGPQAQLIRDRREFDDIYRHYQQRIDQAQANRDLDGARRALLEGEAWKRAFLNAHPELEAERGIIEARRAWRQEHGYDMPADTQYVTWIKAEAARKRALLDSRQPPIEQIINPEPAADNRH
jgi:hypothetical protein